MSPKPWSAALFLSTTCHCAACLCPAIIEYHQGSIPAPSYTSGARHDKLWQVIHSLLSTAMNCFTVISPQGRGLMSNRLFCCACRIVIMTGDSLAQVQFMYLCPGRSGFRQCLDSEFPLNYCNGSWAQHWRSHMVDIMRGGFFFFFLIN